MITQEQRRDRIFTAIELVVGDLMYHDRKDDPDLPLGVIEAAMRELDPGPAIMAAHFEALLRMRVPLEDDDEERGEADEGRTGDDDGGGAASTLGGDDPGGEAGSPDGDSAEAE